MLKQTALFQMPYVFIFHQSLVSGVGSARREKCARRVCIVWTSVIHLRWPTLFVSVAFAAVGGSEELQSQSRFSFRLQKRPPSTLGSTHTFTPGSFPVKPQFDLLVTDGRLMSGPRIVLTLLHPDLFFPTLIYSKALELD